jgi:signal peptidase II
LASCGRGSSRARSRQFLILCEDAVRQDGVFFFGVAGFGKRCHGKGCFSRARSLNTPRLKQNYNLRIAVLALIIFGLDQLTKWTVLHLLPVPGRSEVHVLPGFFRIVHWYNTGAAWSMFSDNNTTLAVISGVALVVLVLVRKKFGSDTSLGSLSLGLIFGGIAGNLLDRIVHGHVVDFLYFHLITREGKLHDFPAFNIADSAICVGVGLLFILSWRPESQPKVAGAEQSVSKP